MKRSREAPASSGRRTRKAARGVSGEAGGQDAQRSAAFGLQTLPGAAELAPAEFVYRQILDAVLSQRLRPGARLTEQAVADIFSTGRATVRDVLQRLALEGVVDIRAHRGASVSKPPAGEVPSLFEARRVIECELVSRTAAAVDAGTVRPVDIEQLAGVTQGEAEHVRAGRRGAALRLACDFHLELARFGAVPPLSDALQRLVVRSALAVGLYERAAPSFDPAQSRRALLQPTVSGNGRAAGRAMRAHLDAVQGSLDLVAPAPGDELSDAFRHLTAP